MRKLKFLVTCLVLVLLACSPPKANAPADILSEDKMVEVLSDIRLAEADAKVARQMQQYNEGSMDSVYFVIFKIHDVTSEQVKTSLEYYGERPELMKEINDKVLEKLNLIN